MDASDKKATYLIFAAVLMGMLILVLISRGLNESTKALYDVEAGSINKNEGALRKDLQAIEQALVQHAPLFTDVQPLWKPLMAQATEKMGAARQHLEKAGTWVEADDDALSDQIVAEITALKKETTYARSVVNVIRKEVVRRTDFAQHRAARVAAAGEKMSSLTPDALEPLRLKVEAASADWPNQRTYLETELADLREASTRAAPYLARIQEENAKPEAQINWPRLISDVTDLETIAESADGRRRNLLSECDQLYVSWDKILTDMEIEEGAEVTFFHTYKKVTVAVKDAAGESVSHTEKTERVKVDKATFEKYKKDLGMVVASKPLGKFDREAEQTPQPAGYGYMCPSSQQHNRYGEWRRDENGASFWSWYGKYAFMSALFGGLRGRVYAPYYDDYRYHRSRGQTYYGSGGSVFGRGGSRGIGGTGSLLRNGTGQRYGTGGSETRKTYGNTSKYLRTGGFKSSRYVRSGGSYRGSRYSSPFSLGQGRSRSYTSPGRTYRSRSFGRSSRFGGGK
jgi:hypothetical protein